MLPPTVPIDEVIHPLRTPERTIIEGPVVVGTAEWDRLTERRAELIDKKHEEGLTDAECEEYERLQRISDAAISVAFPPPVFEPLPKFPEG